MKRKHLKSLLVFTVAALCFVSCKVTSHAEKAQGVNLGDYKTFSWTTTTRKSKAGSEIIDNNIKASVTEQLQKKGLSKVDTNPDLIIDYSVTLPKESRRISRSAYPRMGGQFFMGGRGRSGLFLQPMYMSSNRYQRSSVREGTLTVNMLDAASKKLIWQGWAKDDMDSGNVTTKQVNTDVKAIFKKFDYHY